jgi:hypothetical protein
MGQPLVRPHRECTPRFSGWNDADFSLESPAITRDLDYGYDALGRITTVGAPTASPDETFAYDPLGVPTSLETAAYTWTYDPPTQFGEVPKRKQLGVISEHFGWDAVTGRMSWMGHWTEEEKWRRDYAYDGLGRLLQVKESLPVGAELWRHDIGYDASDQAVWEVRSESGAVTRQVWRHGGFEEDTDEGVTLQVLPMARLVDGDLFWLTQEPDGRAPWVYTDLGAEHAFEVLGATGESLVHVGAEPWHQDHMHGAQIDRSIGRVHHGVRHARVSDGLWMQPEPLLYLGPAKGVLERPLGYGPVYAAGDTNQLHDRSGRHPLVVALLAPIATATAAEVVVAGGIGVTAGTLAGCLAAPEQCQQAADDLAGMANGAAEGVRVGVAVTAELTRRGLEALGDLWDSPEAETAEEVIEAPPADVTSPGADGPVNMPKPWKKKSDGDVPGEHDSNIRPSTREKHDAAQTRRQRDQGGEKGDQKRPYRRTDKKKGK